MSDTVAADVQFVDVICADDAFVQAEFDAIIAAEWDGWAPGPAELPARLRGRRGRPRHRRSQVGSPRAAARRPVLRRGARERSPP